MSKDFSELEKLATLLETKAWPEGFQWYFPVVIENADRYFDGDALSAGFHCGSIGCAIGAGALSGFFGEEIQADYLNAVEACKPLALVSRHQDAMIAQLNIDDYFFEEVFMGRWSYPVSLSHVTPDMVAKRLRDFIEHGKIRTVAEIWPEQKASRSF